MQSQTHNELIDRFIDLFNNNAKQRDENWYKLMGTTVGGSEIASIMGLSPYTSFYKVVESKIEICKGTKKWEETDTISCWWGTVFENIITKYVEFDLGNKIKGSNICIQKYDGHRNSPDGYITANFYKNDEGKYCLWTTDLDESIIEFSMILLLEFKCPITRKLTGDIPKYYIPQVWSGLSVSPIASKGLFVDALFKKCRIEDLGDNPIYDYAFHKKSIKILTNPIAWGVVTFYLQNSSNGNSNANSNANSNDLKWSTLMKIYNDNNNNIVDLGSVNYDTFSTVMAYINDKTLLSTGSSVIFDDGRGSDKLIFDETIDDYITFAYLPWKLFDVTYVLVDREPNFLENIMPLINKVHALVKSNINYENSTADDIKVFDMCRSIYD